MGKNTEISLQNKKAAFVEAMQQTLGNISESCRRVGIVRQTYYNWCASDPDFKIQCNSVNEMVLDWVESELYKRIKEGNPACTIFFLKTKGKNRGYIEKVEQDITIKQNEVFEIGGKKIEF